MSTDDRPLILHCLHRFGVGGLENGVVNLINVMSEQRWRHAVVAITEVDLQFARRIQRNDVQTVSLQKPPGQGLWLYPRLFRLFRQWRPSIVHTRNLGALEFQLPAWAAGVPGRVHGEHGRDIDDVYGTNRRHITMRRAYRPFVQQQIALGAQLGDYLRQRVGVPADRLTMIYNGVDSHRFKPASERMPMAGSPFNDPRMWLLGTVGRLHAVKAQTQLVRAFIDLLQIHPTWRQTLRLVLVGDGPLRADCEALLRDSGHSHLAWFAGERSDVADVMRGLNCFVLPSLAEGISNTILEAMASGLPVVATRVGAAADLVEHGESGLLVSADDVGALTGALNGLVADPGRARRMGSVGRRIVEDRFSLPAMVSAYEAVYDRVLRRSA